MSVVIIRNVFFRHSWKKAKISRKCSTENENDKCWTLANDEFIHDFLIFFPRKSLQFWSNMWFSRGRMKYTVQWMCELFILSRVSFQINVIHLYNNLPWKTHLRFFFFFLFMLQANETNQWNDVKNVCTSSMQWKAVKKMPSAYDEMFNETIEMDLCLGPSSFFCALHSFCFILHSLDFLYSIQQHMLKLAKKSSREWPMHWLDNENKTREKEKPLNFERHKRPFDISCFEFFFAVAYFYCIETTEWCVHAMKYTTKQRQS